MLHFQLSYVVDIPRKIFTIAILISGESITINYFYIYVVRIYYVDIILYAYTCIHTLVSIKNTIDEPLCLHGYSFNHTYSQTGINVNTVVMPFYPKL